MTQSESLNSQLESFFVKVIHKFPSKQTLNILLLTHLLPDRPPFLAALSKMADISRIVAIPYSVNRQVADELNRTYRISFFTLDEMESGQFLLDAFLEDIKSTGLPIAIMEIGGYYAPLGNQLRATYGHKFLGVVEDTEGGHRRYENLIPLKFPVVSVARSRLKRIEDSMIGASVMFSIERFLRGMGQVLAAAEVGVLGYGKIGKSVARAALSRGCRVLVYDPNPYRRLEALADGFQIPDKELLFSRANIIVGATGVQSIGSIDFPCLRKNAILASASSRQVEFDVSSLEQFPHRENEALPSFQEFQITPDNNIYLLAQGKPVNFEDGAVVGPLLALVQAELFLALKTLAESYDREGMLEVSEIDKDKLCELWLEHFLTDGYPTPKMSF